MENKNIDELKRTPYGLADFIDIQKKNRYYVYKTSFIPIVERSGEFLFLIRPRRFGKSLWLAVIACYYDLYRKDEFDSIFSGTYIHSHSTPERSSCLLLRFNFSAVNPAISEEVFDSLKKEIKDQTGIRDYLSGEKVVVGFLLAYLNITDHYIIRSEAEMNKGYADMFLEPFKPRYPGIKYGYLLELKYIKRGDYSEELKKRKVEEAREQLKGYSNDSGVIHIMEVSELKRIVLVFSGWEMVYREEVFGVC